MSLALKRAAMCRSTSPSVIQERFGLRSSVLLTLSFHGSPSLRWDQQVHTQPYASLLRSYASSKTLVNGMCLHAHIIRHKLDSNALLGNLLVQMYGRCGALHEASAVFASLLIRDHFAWNFLIRSYVTSGQAAKSLPLFQQMLLEGILPDRFILVGILSACTISDIISVGKSLHSCVSGSSLETDAVIATAFMNMYANCGNLEYAQRCFDKLPEVDVVSFNSMIAAFQPAGDVKSALQLFNQMQQQSVLPARVTFLNSLSACSSGEFLAEGKRLHSYCSCTDFNDDLAVKTALLNMYGKCHSVDDAQRTFDMMTQHDVVSWNALIAIYAQHRHIKEALHLFKDMCCEGVMPDPITFICILDACGNQGVLLDDDWIQVNIKGSAAGFDAEVGIALMNMHSNCGNIEGVWETFNTSPNRSIAFWNTLVLALVKHGDLDDAFKQTENMYQHDATPNRFTFIALLDACVAQMALVEGRLLHMFIVESHSELDMVTCTSIINMYGKCGWLDEAFKVFQTIHDRKVVSWNSILSGLADNVCNSEVIWLSQRMMQEGVLPNDITILCMLNACFSEETLDRGKRIHSYILGTEHDSNTVLETALVNMYGKCGSTSSALRVFNDLPERDIVSWSAMISAFVQGREIDKAAVLFNQMLEEGALPDAVTYATVLCAFLGPAALSQGKRLHAGIVAAAFGMEVVIETALICMYCRCGSLDEARRLFSERLDKNVASWNAFMGALTQSGHGMRVFQLYEQMQQEGTLPNNVTFVSLLDACAKVTSLSKGHQIHSSIACYNLAGDVKVEAALVNMYADCGSLNGAEMVFRSMCSRNIVSWTAIIAANAQHGNGKNALRLLKQMLDEGHVPKREIMVSVFSACSHTGLIDNLKEFLGFMSSKVSVPVGADLFNCAIDLFSRAGRLDEAEVLIDNMPEGPTIVSWTTLLGACKNQLDVERGERAALKLLQLDAQNAEPYVALSNIYATLGMDERG